MEGPWHDLDDCDFADSLLLLDDRMPSLLKEMASRADPVSKVSDVMRSITSDDPFGLGFQGRRRYMELANRLLVEMALECELSMDSVAGVFECEGGMASCSSVYIKRMSDRLLESASIEKDGDRIRFII